SLSLLFLSVTSFASVVIKENKFVFVSPLGSSQDDGPQIQSALNLGLPVYLKKRATFEVDTKIVPPDYSIMHFQGATVNTAVPTEGGVTGATILATMTNIGAGLTL